MSEGASTHADVIRVAAALIVDEAGRLLLVRKRDTSVFMQPGGKYEPGESGAQTLVRELHEELGLVIDTDALEPLGSFTASAANEAGMLVEAEVFRVAMTGDAVGRAVGRAEIDEVLWAHPDEFGSIAVAPLVTDHMMTFLTDTHVLTITPAERLPWAALERVLASTTEGPECWCRWWLVTDENYAAHSDAERHADAMAAHDAGEPRGLLAVRGAEPVGWVSVAPRPDYVRLASIGLVAEATPDPDFTDPTVWAVICFAVAPAHRRTGVAQALLRAAIAHARSGGARRIEAYPVDTDALTELGETASVDALHTGTLALFTAAGFTEVARSRPARPIVQLTLASGTDASDLQH